MTEDTKKAGGGFKLSELRTDVSKSEEGVWCDVGEGFAIKVARIGHPKYQAYIAKLTKPHTRQIRRQGIGAPILRDIQRKATAKYLLLDWRNLHDDDGNEIPYSETKALELLSDPQYDEFLELVLEYAQDTEIFRAEDEADAEKN